jgi:hypothetical protein
MLFRDTAAGRVAGTHHVGKATNTRVVLARQSEYPPETGKYSFVLHNLFAAPRYVF